MALSRRRFLQISAATFGAGAASAHLPGAALAADAAEKGVRMVPTYCEMCFWRCGGIGYVRDGRLWKFEGNPRDLVSRGRLCTRGTGAVGAVHDPDRLRSPLIRRGRRGSEQWIAVTWNEALDYVAARMKAVAAQHGVESIALFKHGIGVKFIEHVLKSYGVINVTAPSYAQCRGPRDAGFTLTYGAGLGSPEPLDIANSRCLVLMGSHLGENMHNTQAQEMGEAIGRGVSPIVVDPPLSVAASKAKFWLPIKPGTDIALLRAWMNVLVTEGLCDKAFVAEHGEGFDKLAADLKDATPEWAAAETGLDAGQIRETAREMAKHRPATLIHPGRRSNWYGDDSQRGRAMALLNALLGNWAQPGGFFVNHNVKVPPYPLPPYPNAAKPKVDNPREEVPVRRGGTLAGHPRGHPHRQALSDQGLVRLLVQPDLRAAQPEGDAGGDREARSAGGDRHRTQRDRRLRGRGPARGDVPRALRRAQRGVGAPGLGADPPAGGAAGLRRAAGLVDRQATGGEARHRGIHAVQGHGGVPRLPHPEGGAVLRAAEARRRDRRTAAADLRPRRRRRGVRHALRQGRVLVAAARRREARSGAAVHASGGGAAGHVPAHHRARADAHLHAHPVQPAAARPHVHQRGVGERRRGEATRPPARPAGAAAQPGRRHDHGHAGEGDRAHPPRLRVHGARLGINAPLLRIANGRGASTAQLNTRYRIDPVCGGTSIHTNFVSLVKEA